MINNSRWLQVLIVELVIIATFYLLQIFGGMLAQFANIFLLFFLAWLLAFALRPLIRALGGLGVPLPLSVILIYLALVFVFVGIGLVIIPQLTAQLNNLNAHQQDYYNQIVGMAATSADYFASWTGQKLDPQSILNQAMGPIQSLATSSVGTALSWLQTAASLMFDVILVVLISVYIALDGDRLGSVLVNALPTTWRDEIILLGTSIGRSFGGFLRGQVIFAAIYGVLNFIIMTAFGLQLALIASIIAGACMLIPLVGNFLAFLPPVIIALITPDKAGQWWIVLLVMFIMQSIMMQVVGPRIMSSAVGIHPLFTMMAMLLGAQVAGIWGALFGIPVAGVIGLVASSFLGRVRQFFNAGEATPMIGMVMSQAVPAEGGGAGPPGAQEQVAVPEPTGAVGTVTRPRLPAVSQRTGALLRGISRLATTTRRSGSKR